LAAPSDAPVFDPTSEGGVICSRPVSFDQDASRPFVTSLRFQLTVVISLFDCDEAERFAVVAIEGINPGLLEGERAVYRTVLGQQRRMLRDIRGFTGRGMQDVGSRVAVDVQITVRTKEDGRAVFEAVNGRLQSGELQRRVELDPSLVLSVLSSSFNKSSSTIDEDRSSVGRVTNAGSESPQDDNDTAFSDAAIALISVGLVVVVVVVAGFVAFWRCAS